MGVEGTGSHWPHHSPAPPQSRLDTSRSGGRGVVVMEGEGAAVVEGEEEAVTLGVLVGVALTLGEGLAMGMQSDAAMAPRPSV